MTVPWTNLPDPSPVLQPLPTAAQKPSTQEEAQSIKAFNANPCKNKHQHSDTGGFSASHPIFIFKAQRR